MNPKLTVLGVLFLLTLPVAEATIPSKYARQSDDWFRSEEGRRIADNVLTWQSPHGSWPKNGDTASRPYEGEKEELDGTFDNGATTGELRFLAQAVNATSESRYQQVFLKGLDHILLAQYPTGGWPQFYPVSNRYHRHITFNDNSMVRILEFLREVSDSPGYAFVAPDRRASAKTAFDKGIQCILDCQIVVNGKRTVWCAQHDEVDFRPRPARSYELESLSGGESASIVRLLMSLDNPSPEIQRAIRATAEWYESARITGIRVVEKPEAGRVVIEDPDAPALWARFYEIETNRPFFCDRDGIPKYDFNELGDDRRNGYRWYGGWGKEVAATYEEWKQRWPDRSDPVQKPRIIHTTDLGADPDDEQSMVRQLACANEFDIEGLIVATGCWKKTQSHTAMLDRIVNAYGEVLDNLQVHADGYPSLKHLKSVSVMGQRGYGMADVGAGKDSPGSELIIASVDKDDPRPVWLTGWGGVNTIAQAVWKVRDTRSPEDLAKFLGKIRVFDILGQDDAGAWLAKTFPDLFYIRATGVYGWQPPKNGSYQREDIQSHGPLGAVYPDTKWATEGDTPAFMHVYPNGLNDPEKVDQGGWGGRFSLTKRAGIRSMRAVEKETETQYDPYYMYGNTSEGASAIKRWSKGYNNDFAARMDWTITRQYADANHHPIAVLNGDKSRQVLQITAAAGSSAALNAAGSSDPDGHSLVYSWSFYDEPSSYDGTVTIQNSSSAAGTAVIPPDAGGKSIHIILELHDDGSPNLYAYRRLIINVQ